MVKITKNEAQILNVKYEIPFKEFGGLTRTCSCHHKRKTYYLTESNYNLNALSEIRKKYCRMTKYIRKVVHYHRKEKERNKYKFS